MAGRKLRTYVHVHDDETGTSKVYGPNDDVPAAVAKKIKNPDVWADEPVTVGINDPGNSGTPSEEEAAKLAADAAKATQEAADATAAAAQSSEDGGDGDPGNSGTPVDQPPPRTGAGSGAEAWRAYAGRQGVDVPPDASRDDVIGALEDAGKLERQS